jgi:endonuclease/exonuclease/phosphatase family metal-dependent hydrolase
MARIRLVTFNMEQDHKRWETRRELIAEQLVALKPDVLALNEVCVPLQTARWVQRVAKDRMGIEYALVQQTKVNSLAGTEAEALLTRFALMETGNLDYQARDMVALVARILVDGAPVDVYVTHLYMSRGDDSLRLYQVQQLLAWIDSRKDVTARIVCGDFNATLDKSSAALMATRFRHTQAAPTAFTPLAERDGTISHPYWPRMDRCIDYIWVSEDVTILESGVCLDKASPGDASLWPSDHVAVWADLEFANSSSSGGAEAHRST